MSSAQGHMALGHMCLSYALCAALCTNTDLEGMILKEEHLPLGQIVRFDIDYVDVMQ